MVRAIFAERSRMVWRSPGKRKVREVVLGAECGVLRAMQTVPTGLASVPPSGPATPEIARATSDLAAASAPWAIASTTGCETAPFFSRRFGGAARSWVLACGGLRRESWVNLGVQRGVWVRM